ncbi:hypothetical protein [Cohnella cellulosilytica]|uniref:hypothetical protein n=1 Tax=Cohnella cellulosilytica TaxID=986710 RepID=UPI00362127D4
MNAAEEIEETLLASCRRELIEEGKLVLTDTGYQLTELGQRLFRRNCGATSSARPCWS